MGLTHVTATIRDLAAATPTPFEAEFLVDTGSIDCMAPGEKLHAAGVRPEGKRVYELANGQPIEYEYGFARVAFFGDETVTPIIFGPADTEPILGVVALESVGVVVDPITRTLRRLHAKPLKCRKNPLHNPTTFFVGSLQEFTGESLPLDHPIVLERERKRREASPSKKRPRKKKD